ncbi:MAG: AraC family transcriptional regulator [Microvirga sp.]
MRQAISPVFIPTLDKSVPVPKGVSFRCYNLGKILLSAITASPQTIERTQTQIATQGVDHVILRLYNSGRSSIDTADGDEEIAPGSFVLFDLSQRARSVSAGMNGINLCIPRRLFDTRVGEVSALHRGRFGGGPLFTLLADHVRNVRACLDSSDAGQQALLASATVDIVNAAFTDSRDSAHNVPAIVGIEMRQYIESALGREDLDTEMLAARFGRSRSAVYSLFEVDGGVMAYIRHRRLARAMRILSGIEGEGPHRISDVAYACGYASPKMFSKAFRARYGVAPRDVDATFRQQAYHEAGAQLLSWIREL